MNGGLRLITGAFRTTKALNMHCELGMLPLEYKREIAIGKKAIQILGNKNNPQKTNKYRNRLQSSKTPTYKTTLLLSSKKNS